MTHNSTVEHSTLREELAPFADWVQKRRRVYLSTNSFSEDIAFQNWRRFKEAFAPELVERAIVETSEALRRKTKTCVDPFGGSGTTALSCQFLGVDPITIEVNPFLAELIEAKLASYDVSKISRALENVLAKRRGVGEPKLFANAPNTFVEPGKDGRFIFSKQVARRLIILRDRIRRVRDRNVRRLFRVLLSAISIELSNVVVSGKGRRYRANSGEKRQTAKDVDEAFAQSVLAATFDIARYAHRNQTNYTVMCDDARAAINRIGSVDLAVFSPPYPNSFDYTDVYNVELWVGGYLKSSQDNINLRNKTLRSHVQIKRNFNYKRGVSKTLTATLNKLDGKKEDLWNRNIPEMIGAYFDDLVVILNGLKAAIVPGGRAYIVVGNSKYVGIEIDVARILIEICKGIGFKMLYQEPFRAMRSSPQQGGKKELQETLLVFGRL